MRNVNIREVNSLTELDHDFKCFEPVHENRKKNNILAVTVKENKTSDVMDQNLIEIGNQVRLFDYVSSGLNENIEKIVNIIKKDPARYLYESCDKHYYLVNKTNSDGLTLLYIACLNGHSNMVELLIKHNADHLQTCGV